MGIGGGHDRAAGAKIISLVDIVTPEKVSQIIIDWLKNNQPVIN
jgi:nanoRNase/pAp phosphatase (c-di-AMP/oligoRNAs hydrolase)